jgi:hypothetical protein
VLRDPDDGPARRVSLGRECDGLGQRALGAEDRLQPPVAQPLRQRREMDAVEPAGVEVDEALDAQAEGGLPMRAPGQRRRGTSRRRRYRWS